MLSGLTGHFEQLLKSGSHGENLIATDLNSHLFRQEEDGEDGNVAEKLHV